ncbi:twin-arginine translocase subunit TatC [Halorientalis regularis]|uniref:Sec-independent protein translocase protein TatC n=1 Tax=Halorientalis regularis TaxID=660518 RepID=A0A1G7GZU8_9EURY|nr:twin-arginine translocase subunit TatC [Halorientalis regularis]SDE93469.1 sec-independent protein translocase protein TatC [Halorientalis regularis]
MSGAIDDDTRRAVNSGRQTIGAMLSAAQSHLQKVFIVAVLGLMGTIYALREFGWAILKEDLFSRLAAKHPEAFESTKIIARTPFDVILLQVKIGLVVGILLGLPVFLWYSRDGLRQRGLWPGERVARWKIALIVLMSVLLLAVGVSYGYYIFFPIMFDFLAANAYNVGFQPTYSIVKWAEFVFLLTISFGLAAQLPLAMSALAYSGIVPYETFRDKWRHAVVAIFVFGALFSPPEPFTQIMWAIPLLILYAFSLQLTKIVVVAKRSGSEIDVPGVARANWNVLAGVAFLAGVAVYGFFTRGGVAAANRAIASLPFDTSFRVAPASRLLGLPDDIAAALLGLVVALFAVGVALLVFVSRALGAADRARSGPAPASAGAPSEISLDPLDAGGVRAAPPEAFADLSEDDAVAKARAAMDEDDHEKAQAILDRYDEVQDQLEARKQAAEGETDAADEDEEGGTATQTAAGMVDAFTEDETTEEDIGGYYYDIAFILESLTSKAFRLVGLFMVVLAGSFIWLYRGGIREIKNLFFSKVPEGVGGSIDIVTLHPVEALIFQIKFSTLLAIVTTLPLLLYYAWPSLKARGWVRGDARVMLVWGGSLILGLIVGSIVGFLFVAPAVISWLAADAIQANMVIAYRINNFGWLVVYTTVGIGLLLEVPVSMALFHVGGIASYQTQRKYWREVVVAIFALAAFISPRGVFTMLLMAVPAALAYLAGLGLLWLITLGGRRGRPQPQEPTVE